MTDDQSVGARGGPLRPLTRRNSEGAVYQRLPAIEEQIGVCLSLKPEDLLAKARIENPAHPDSIKEETLTYLIRDCFQRGDRDLAGSLAELLKNRCLPLLRTWLRALDKYRFEEASLSITDKLFTLVFNFKSDLGDYLQVRFKSALHRMAISEFRKTLPEMKFTEKDKEDGEGEWLDGVETPELSPEQLMLLESGLASIKNEKHRVAFVLRYCWDWPVEDKDPDVPTISSYFRKTPRMIRYWIEEAHKALEAWREGKS